MTVGGFLEHTISRLKAAGIETARLDSLILLEDVTGRGRAYLLAHPEHELSDTDTQELERVVRERERHVPLAYLRGHTHFYGRKFTINEHVLVPRPETEAIIELLLKLPVKRGVIADIGTGSGCIGITAALELPESSVYLYDVDPLALMTARQNAQELGARISSAHSNLLDEAIDTIDIILTNLPYVPNGLPVNKAAQHEPALALFAGDDGLNAYRSFWHQVGNRAHKPDYILTESLAMQHAKVAALAKKAGYRLTGTHGLVQQFER